MKNLLNNHHIIEKFVENLHGLGDGEGNGYGYGDGNGYADKYEF